MTSYGKALGLSWSMECLGRSHGLGTSLGTPFTMIPSTLFQIMYHCLGLLKRFFLESQCLCMCMCAPQLPALHCIALHCIAFHCISFHCISLHFIAFHCIALHCIALKFSAVRGSAVQCSEVNVQYTLVQCSAVWWRSHFGMDLSPPGWIPLPLNTFHIWCSIWGGQPRDDVAVNIGLLKLKGLGPIDNRPSTD